MTTTSEKAQRRNERVDVPHTAVYQPAAIRALRLLRRHSVIIAAVLLTPVLPEMLVGFTQYFASLSTEQQVEFLRAAMVATIFLCAVIQILRFIGRTLDGSMSSFGVPDIQTNIANTGPVMRAKPWNDHSTKTPTETEIDTDEGKH